MSWGEAVPFVGPRFSLCVNECRPVVQNQLPGGRGRAVRTDSRDAEAHIPSYECSQSPSPHPCPCPLGTGRSGPPRKADAAAHFPHFCCKDHHLQHSNQHHLCIQHCTSSTAPQPSPVLNPQHSNSKGTICDGTPAKLGCTVLSAMRVCLPQVCALRAREHCSSRVQGFIESNLLLLGCILEGMVFGSVVSKIRDYPMVTCSDLSISRPHGLASGVGRVHQVSVHLTLVKCTVSLPQNVLRPPIAPKEGCVRPAFSHGQSRTP